MAGNTLYCLPTDILSYTATWSAPAGAIDAEFPLTNLNSVYAHKITKFTGTSGTLRGTIASTAVRAIVLINGSQKLAGLSATITNNNAMASTPLAIQALTADGLGISGYVDLLGITTAATQWNVAFSGVAAGGFGCKVLLLSTLRTMPIRWNARIRERKPTRVFVTEGEIKIGSRKAVRYRTFLPTINRESERAAYTNLRRASEGPTQPFVFIFDHTVNDPAYTWFPDDEWEVERAAPETTPWSDRLEEANAGQAH